MQLERGNISYYHNRSKLALLKVHSLNSWLVSVTRNSGYHLCSDLSVNGRNFAVFFQPIKCRPDISRTLWFPAFCPFWTSYPSISYSFICLKASSSNHRSNFYERLASLQGGHCCKLSSSIKLSFLCLLAIFLEQLFVSAIAGNPNDKKKHVLFCFFV